MMRRVFQKTYGISLFIGLSLVVLTGCLDEDTAKNSFQFRINHVAVDPDPHEPDPDIDPATYDPVKIHDPGVSHSGLVFVATEGGGILKSNDGGSTWSSVFTGLTDLNVTWIEFDRAEAVNIPAGQFRRIYAGTENGGVFQSTNGGDSWVALAGISTATEVSSIVVDPGSCINIPVCSDLYVSSLTSGVWVSRDGGVSWNTFNDGLVSQEITRLGFFEFNTPPILLAGTANGEMHKIETLNTQNTWEPLNKPSPLVNEAIFSIEALTPVTFFAGVSGTPDKRGIFKTIDGGTTWTKVQTNDNDVRLIVLDPSTLDPEADPSPIPVFYSGALGVSISTEGFGDIWDRLLGDVPNTPGEEPEALDIFWAAVDYHHVDSLDPKRKAVYASTFNTKLLMKFSDDITPGTWEWRTLNLN